MNSIKLSVRAHEKPVNKIKYNNDGDLIFSSSSDKLVSMLNSETLDVIGQFSGHNGSVLDIVPFDFNICTSSTDLTASFWDITNGKQISSNETNGIARAICRNNEASVFYCTDDSMNYTPHLGFIDFREGKSNTLVNFTAPTTSCISTNDSSLIIGDVNGNVHMFDIKSSKFVMSKKFHLAKITSLNPSLCQNFFVSTSVDCVFLLIDAETMEILHKFESTDPVFSAAIHPENNLIISVGGPDAKMIAYSTGNSQLNTDFYDIVTEKKIGSFLAHNGTVNTVDISPDGSSCVSGAHDGQICLIKFGDDVMSAPFTEI